MWHYFVGLDLSCRKEEKTNKGALHCGCDALICCLTLTLNCKSKNTLFSFVLLLIRALYYGGRDETRTPPFKQILTTETLKASLCHQKIQMTNKLLRAQRQLRLSQISSVQSPMHVSVWDSRPAMEGMKLSPAAGKLKLKLL